MKVANEQEREQLKKEERMAKSFKFTKMSKKMPFLPSIKQRDGFEAQKHLDNTVPYMDHRNKEKLMFPSKVLDRNAKWTTRKTCDGDFLSKPVG